MRYADGSTGPAITTRPERASKFAITPIVFRRGITLGVFADIAESLQYGLTAHGFDTVIHPVDVDRRIAIFPSDRRCIVIAADIAAYYGRELPRDAIIYNMEFIPPAGPGGATPPEWSFCQGGKPYYMNLMRSGRKIVDYSAWNIRHLSSRGIAAKHLRVGYSPGLTHWGTPPVEKDIDVVLVGHMNDRRQRVIDQLRERGYNAVGAFGVYGEARDLLYARSKIALNVHYYETNAFEIVRVSYLFANQNFVVSETGCEAPEDTEYSTSAVFCPYDQLVETCVKHLREPEADRRAQALAGFRFFTENRKIEDMIKPVLEYMVG